MPDALPSDTWCPAPWSACVVNSDGSTAVCPIGPRVDLDADGRLDAAQVDRIKSSMLRGERLRECEKCWFHERNGIRSLRQGYLDIWSGKIEPGRAADPSYDPRFYFDLSLGNKCNQRCRICNPGNSTGWFRDAERLDHMPWTHVSGPREVRSADGMIDGVMAMMDASPLPLEIELKGGEPLYLDETRSLLSAMIDRGLHERTEVLKVLTNGTVTDDVMLSLIGSFPAIDLGISVDAVGDLHSYTRGGPPWEDCLRGWHRLAGLPNIRHLGIANTIYIYNVFDQVRLYEWANAEFGITKRMSNAVLAKPLYLNVKVMPDALRRLAVDSLSSHPMRGRLDGLVSVLEQDVTDEDVLPRWSRKSHTSIGEISIRLSRLRGKFRDFTNALDGMRGQRLLDLVPELHPMML